MLASFKHPETTRDGPVQFQDAPNMLEHLDHKMDAIGDEVFHVHLKKHWALLFSLIMS